MANRFSDRVPTQPNRYKITPANGAGYYATLERADEPSEAGTPLNAANLNEMVDRNGDTMKGDLAMGSHKITGLTAGTNNTDAVNVKQMKDLVSGHTDDKNNPHGVTKSQVGLGNVPNVATNDQTPTYSSTSTLTVLNSGEKLSAAFSKIAKAISDLISHIGNKSNPHSVTKAQVGLGSVDNTSDTNKPVSTAQATAIADAKKAGTTAQTNLTTHIGDKSNPHGVTKSQVGLGNVNNTSDANKPVSTAQATAIADAKKAGTDAQTNLNTHANRTDNPHAVKAAQTGAIVADNGRQDIPEGADLNGADFLKIGAWRATTTARATSLLNCPVKVAFTFDILAGTGFHTQVSSNAGYIIQRITTNEGDIYFRRVYGGSSGLVYNDWHHFYSSKLKPTAAELGVVEDIYGLGKSAPPLLADANKTTPAGFSRVTSSTANLGGATHYSVLVLPYSGSEVVQMHARTTSGAIRFRRTDDSGATWASEWLNPALADGTEYATVMRYNGKVVYEMVKSTGALPNTGSKQVSLGVKATELVHMELVGTPSSSVQYRNVEHKEFMKDLYFKPADSSYVQIETNANASNYTAKVHVWYIKD